MNMLVTPFKTQERVYRFYSWKFLLKIYYNIYCHYILIKREKVETQTFYNRYIFSIYKNLIYRSAIGCTTYSGVYKNKFDSFLTLEHATHNWPWEKHRADALDGKHVNNIIGNTISSFQINALILSD